MAEGLMRSSQYTQSYIIDETTAKIMDVKSRMAEHLSSEQSRQLGEVLQSVFGEKDPRKSNTANIEAFISAKALEGCTDKTLNYYLSEVEAFTIWCGKPFAHIASADIRGYLAYRKSKGNGDTTLNNVRRILASFFQWLEDEDLIRKSPVRKVKAIRCVKQDKKPFSDIEVEKLKQCARNYSSNPVINARTYAIVELLYSSGIRVGELVGMKRDTTDLTNRSAIVFGKGKKYRTCYFSAAAALAIKDYLSMRTDDAPWLFVASRTCGGCFNRISAGGIEGTMRSLGVKAGIEKCHPHRFRRTMATRNLSKGMKLEEIQKLLGHERMDTTLMYAQINEDNVRNTAMRFI